MKKTWLLIAAALVGVLILSAGAAVYAYAQGGTPTPEPPRGFGHGRGFGPDHGLAHPDGPLHDYLQSAIADALGVSVDELQSQTPWQIAQAQGLSQDEFAARMQQAREAAIDAALADGAITQEQADWLRAHPAGHGPKDHANGGALRPYLDDAIAAAFGLTSDQWQTMRENGQSLWDYAAEQGMTVADFQSKMESARNAAIDAALADGAITQQQADALRNAPAHGFGPGGCGGGPGRHGGRFGQP